MELGREMFEHPVFPLGEDLGRVTSGAWYWLPWIEDEDERGAAIMATEETPWGSPSPGGDRLLSIEGDEPSMAVGSEEGLTLSEQMAALEDLLREFARKCDDKNPLEYRAQKALYRCVDNLRTFNNG